MPLKSGSSLKDCISKNYKIEISAGKEKKQAQAIALNHCNKIWGGASKSTKKNELEELQLSILFDELDLEIIEEKLEEEKKKWIQKAVPAKNKGKFKDWCKEHGYGGVSDECIKAALKKGGHAAKMASFAKAMRKTKK